MAPTNVFFSPAVRTEQMLFEDLIIEGLRMYGQDVLYIPRVSISTDEILNEDYSRFNDAYQVEMYIANTQGFEGEGTLLSKFGLEIRDQATFIVARRRFNQLVEIDSNALASERPREGDLIYLPLSNSMFEIKFVEHEQPFYRLNDLPTYELQCELFEYTSERIDTGIEGADQFEREHATRTVVEITGGTTGFAPGTLVYQIVVPGDSDTDQIEVTGEVADFVTTREADPSQGITRQGDLSIVQVSATDGELRDFSPDYGNLYLEDDDSDTGWAVTKTYDLMGVGKYIPEDPFADNATFEVEGDAIIDFSTINPFGDPRVDE
jgi:hypothetical protein